MRTDKLGSRLLRVVTPDGKVRYFRSTPGLTSLRLFWIFRNFNTLNDSVLSLRQHALIRQIYRTGEVLNGAVDPKRILGTLEVSSRSCMPNWAAPSRLIQLSIVRPSRIDRQPLGKLLRLALNLTGVVGVLLFIVGLLGIRDARRQPTAFTSSPANLQRAQDARSTELRETHQTISRTAPDSLPPATALKFPSYVPDNASKSSAELGSPGEPASADSADEDVISSNLSSASRDDLQRTSSAVVSSPVLDPIQSLDSSTPSSVSATEELPSSGPPQTHPVLADFSPVSQDTEVVLRAIVSADGSVTKVKVLEGDSKLAREAARAVTSWRYSRRASTGYAESRIAFHFAPDTVSVSFLDAATSNTRR